MTKAKLTILGCGNSTGIPAIGNYWGACDPDEPKNRRLRSSILLQTEQTTIVVDTGPDFREQLNRADVPDLDAVLYSHFHGDHVQGMDELRVIKHRNQKEYVNIYGNRETIRDLKRRFDYLFHGGNHKLYPPIVQPYEIDREEYGTQLQIGDIPFTPFEQDHGSCMSLGYRFGDCGYSVDILKLDAAAVKALKGIKTWIVDCAAYKDEQNAVHANMKTIFALNEEIGAENVYLTSLSLTMDYQTLQDELPQGYRPAYDGLELNVLLS